jgi:hypothetical protein
LRSDLLSRDPNHPALGLLVPNIHGSLTAEEDTTQAGEDTTQAVPTRVEKRKTRSSEDQESYEVEEILGHRQDKQVSI